MFDPASRLIEAIFDNASNRANEIMSDAISMQLRRWERQFPNHRFRFDCAHGIFFVIISRIGSSREKILSDAAWGAEDERYLKMLDPEFTPFMHWLADITDRYQVWPSAVTP